MLLTPSARYRTLLVAAAFLAATCAYQPAPVAPDFHLVLAPDTAHQSQSASEPENDIYHPADLSKFKEGTLDWAMDAFSEDPVRVKRAKQALLEAGARDDFAKLYLDGRSCGHKVHFKVDSVSYEEGDEWLTLNGNFAHGSQKPVPFKLLLSVISCGGRLLVRGFSDPNGNSADALATYPCVGPRHIDDWRGSIPTRTEYFLSPRDHSDYPAPD